jgi:hypothetical protein
VAVAAAVGIAAVAVVVEEGGSHVVSGRLLGVLQPGTMN